MAESPERAALLAGFLEALFASTPTPSYQPPNPSTEPTEYAAYKKQMDDWLEHTGRQFLISARPYLSVEEALKPVPKSLPIVRGYALTPRQTMEYNDLKLRYMYHKARLIRIELQKYDNDIAGRKRAIIRFGEFLHEASGGPTWRETMHPNPTPSAVYVEQSAHYPDSHGRSPYDWTHPPSEKLGAQKTVQQKREATSSTAAANQAQAQHPKSKQGEDVRNIMEEDDDDHYTDSDDEVINDYMNCSTELVDYLERDEEMLGRDRAELYRKWDDGEMDEATQKRMQLWLLKQMRNDLKQSLRDTRSGSSTSQIGKEGKDDVKGKTKESVNEGQGNVYGQGKKGRKGDEKAQGTGTKVEAASSDKADQKNPPSASVATVAQLLARPPALGLPVQLPKASVSSVELNLAAFPDLFCKGSSPSLEKMKATTGEKQTESQEQNEGVGVLRESEAEAPPKQKLDRDENMARSERDQSTRKLLLRIEEQIAKEKESRRSKSKHATQEKPEKKDSGETKSTLTATKRSASLGKRKALNLSPASSGSDITPLTSKSSLQPVKKKIATHAAVPASELVEKNSAPKSSAAANKPPSSSSPLQKQAHEHAEGTKKRVTKKLVVVVYKKRFLPSKRPFRDCWHSHYA